MSDEWANIAAIRERVGADPRVPIGIGDDAAELLAGPRLLATTDMLLEGVHFTVDADPFMVGRKAMNVNLSDIAAMGGWPRAALVAVGLPSGRADDLPDRLFQGLRSAAAAFDVAIVGGDTNRSRGGLVVAVTLLGDPGPKGAIRRSGAEPGDALFVTGSLGYSLGGRHLDFTPRLAEARDLVVRFSPSSLLDTSDGLGGDLFHLATESGVAIEFDADWLPIAERPAGFPDDGRAPVSHALDDGEDFELLFTLPPGDADRLEAEGGLLADTPATRIGRVVAGTGVTLCLGPNRWTLPRGGYTHGWDRARGAVGRTPSPRLFAPTG